MPDEKDEKLEFLKRVEVRTMQKDLSRLRENEAQVAQDKLTKLKPHEKTVKPIKEAEEIPFRKEIPVNLIPKELPKKLSSSQKIIVRTGLVLILILTAGFFYWSLVKEESTTDKVADQPAEQPVEEPIEQPVEEPVKMPEIVIPSSLIPVETVKNLEIENLNEAIPALSNLLKDEIEPRGFTRILIENKTENKILGLKDFFEIFEINSPENLLPGKLDDNPTFFIYSNLKARRFGFIAKVTEAEGMLDLLKKWETTMEQDTEKLFNFLGKDKPALSQVFKTASHQGKGFRFLTISRDDFGICYAWIDDYFIFTSSFESMQKSIEKINSGETDPKIGQMLIIGFEGKTVTPELEDIFRKYRPGGVLLLAKNVENETQLKNLTQDLQALSLKETGLPLLIAVDQEGGEISRIGFLQEKTAQSEIENQEMAYQIGTERGQELKELGINLNLAPVLDITEETDFLFERSFKKPAEETGELAKSLVLGQKTAGILSSIKHFPGYVGITFNPEKKLAIKDNIPEISQFKKVLESNPEIVMVSNVIYREIDPSLPFAFSLPSIQFLKNNLNSEILIVSDDLAQNYLLEFLSLEDLFVKPISAGLDLLIFSGWELDVEQSLNVFFNAFQRGELPREKIEEAVLRIINLKQNML